MRWRGIWFSIDEMTLGRKNERIDALLTIQQVHLGKRTNAKYILKTIEMVIVCGSRVWVHYFFPQAASFKMLALSISSQFHYHFTFETSIAYSSEK